MKVRYIEYLPILGALLASKIMEKMITMRTLKQIAIISFDRDIAS